MPPDISRSFHGLRSSAPFWSLRLHHETREVLAMRQDTLEPPRLAVDRGAMLTAVTDGGYGYCATRELSLRRAAHARDGEPGERHAGAQLRSRAAGRLRAGRALGLRRQRRTARRGGAAAPRRAELPIGKDGSAAAARSDDAASARVD